MYFQPIGFDVIFPQDYPQLPIVIFLKQYEIFADDATLNPTLRGIKILGDHMSLTKNRAKSMMMLDSAYIDGLDEVKN